MYIIASFCDMHWLLSWLLPFLLGLLLGWWIWSRFKKMVADLEGQIKGYKGTISDLEAKLAACKSARADLEGELALAKGKAREVENELNRLRKDGGEGSDTSALEAEMAALRAAKEKAEAEATTLRADLVNATKAASDAQASSGASNLAAGVAGATLAGDGDSVSSKLGAAVESAAAGDSIGGHLSGYAGLKSDNLQIIEGIGPKMESVLQENGVHNWGDLAGKSTDDLRAILNNYGDKYKIINPDSWTRQAELAHAGDWAGLSQLQKELDGGGATSGNNDTDAKVDKMLVKLGLVKQYKENDLKVVEGIGPKIEQLLNGAGINTWVELAEASTDRLQEILTAAGSRYQLADPGTWPEQARMAADGDWDKLEDYQDYLQGGKG